MNKTIYGISLGPGTDTMTLKAAELLQKADVILLSGSTNYNNPTEVKNILDKIGCGHKLIPFTMPASSDREAHGLHTKNFAKKCADFINSGKKTVYVTMGDITIYTSFGELHKILKDMGIDLQAITGVPSFMAPAAAIGRALVEWNENFCLVPMPKTTEALVEYVKNFDSVLIMKIYDDGEILKQFLENTSLTIAVMVINASKDSEKICDLLTTFPENENIGMSVVLLRK